MDSWLAEIDDLGFMPELELIERLWPGGEQPETEAPRVSHSNGIIQLSSATAGANIAYQILPAKADDVVEELSETWQLYSRPFQLAADEELITLAHRIGFAPSEQVSYRRNRAQLGN